MKITVIATGFGDGRPGRGARPGADTPVAIESYQTWYEEHRQAAPAAETGSATPSIPVRRRSVISVPAQARAVVERLSRPSRRPRATPRRTTPSPFDVPAFLAPAGVAALRRACRAPPAGGPGAW